MLFVLLFLLLVFILVELVIIIKVKQYRRLKRYYNRIFLGFSSLTFLIVLYILSIVLIHFQVFFLFLLAILFPPVSCPDLLFFKDDICSFPLVTYPLWLNPLFPSWILLVKCFIKIYRSFQRYPFWRLIFSCLICWFFFDIVILKLPPY